MLRWWVLGLIGCQATAPVVASAPAPGAPRVVIAAPELPIGTAGPFKLIFVAQNGRWMAMCQARADTDGNGDLQARLDGDTWFGDALHGYLIRGAGPGTPIDGFVSSSGDDRWLVIVRDHQLVLLDDLSGVETMLPGADLSPNRMLRRQAVFDRHGEHVIYFRSTGSAMQLETRVVVHALATGVEHVLPTLRGVIIGIKPRLGTSWAQVALVEPDTGYQMRVVPGTILAIHGHCDFVGPPPPVKIWDRSRTVWLDLASGAVAVTDPTAFADGAADDGPAFVAHDRTIVDVAHGRELGEVPRTPLALDTAGRALLPATGCNHELCIGPLRWVTARPGRAEPETDARSAELAFTGTAVDVHGAPIAGAVITLDDSDDDVVWTFPTRNRGRSVEASRSSQHRVPGAVTDEHGTFTVTPASRPTVIMLVARDGRIGVAELGAARPKIVELRAPGAIRVTCERSSVPEEPSSSRIDLALGGLRIEARCGDTISGLPAGRYRAAAGERALDVEVPPGVRAELRLGTRVTAALRGRAVSYPGGQPLAGAGCRAVDTMTHAETERAPSGADGRFSIDVQPGTYRVACDLFTFEGGSAFGAAPSTAAIDVPMVLHHRGGVRSEIKGDAEPRGLRLSYAKGRPVRAGMQAGDLVTAVDGVALAGLDLRSVQALAFTIPPEAAVRWTVERAGQTLTLTSEAW